MATCFGDNLFAVFDVREDSREFLISLIESGTVPDDQVQHLLDQSLVGGAEDWHYLIECARSIQSANIPRPVELNGRDTLAFVWDILDNPHDALSWTQAWGQTDRLISLAKELERKIETQPPSLPPQQEVKSEAKIPPPRAKRKIHGTKSHYWSDEPAQKVKRQDRIQWKTTKPAAVTLQEPISHKKINAKAEAICANYISNTQDSSISAPLDCASGRCETVKLQYDVLKKEGIIKTQSIESPYFLQLIPKKKEALRIRRRRPGTISCVPFHPLTSPSFGLIQEKAAHELFWLLIAITFLIKTNGKLAILTFYKLKERFPTLPDLINPDNEKELLEMIQHLGLSRVRLRYIHGYVRAFLEQPPKAGVRYRVKNYERRVASPARELFSNSEDETSVTPDGTEDLEAWETGHMTQGKYAIDSWRIFCRDELLGRAEDWNGKGREPEFQPEWMRARPDDKELRACLRWMWMREGWEWDPITNERTVLRDEMCRVVNEGRVEYDETGALRILEAPADQTAMMQGE